MRIADKYFIETLHEIESLGQWDENPRPKWADGTPAHSKFVSQKSFDYRIDLGEFPIQGFRPTAVKGGWYDIEAIYIKQTNIIEEMHPSIWPWWKDFVVEDTRDSRVDSSCGVGNCIGQTYGHTVKRYDLVNKLLSGMEKNPFGRRHIMNLWQEQQMEEDPKALVPCAYETLYTISRGENKYYVDMTLNQRSMDFLMTASINPVQYVMLGLAICGHLTFTTGITHTLRNFKHNIQNVHIYDRHMVALEELRYRDVSEMEFSIELLENKNFYHYTIKDFSIFSPCKIQPLKQRLEIAV